MALGALPALLRRARLGGPRAQPRATTSGAARPIPQGLSFETYLDDVRRGLERVGPNAVVVGHGMGGLLALKAAAERVRVAGLVLLDAEAPAAIRPPGKPHVVRDVPPVYGRAVLGWETLPEKLQRENRDLTLDDVLRIQHLLGQKPRESGRARASDAGRASRCDRDLLDGRAHARHRRRARRHVPPRSTAERLADWLGARVRAVRRRTRTTAWCSARRGYRQVADAVRAFLETHRL